MIGNKRLFLALLFAVSILTTGCVNVYTDGGALYIDIFDNPLQPPIKRVKYLLDNELGSCAVFDDGHDLYVWCTSRDDDKPFVRLFRLDQATGQLLNSGPIDAVPRGQFQPLQSFNLAPPPPTSSSPQFSNVALFSFGPRTATTFNDFFRFGLNANGLGSGSKRALFTNSSTTFPFGGSISRDGKIAVQQTAQSQTSWQLSTRLINNGNPKGAPKTWSIPPYSGYSPDISGPIEVSSPSGFPSQRVRYLVYRAFQNVSTPNQQSQVMIQTIDDATGAPIGSARPLSNLVKALLGTMEAFQSIAISADGQFVVYTVYSSCKKQIVKGFQLSPAGTKIGGEKVLVTCSRLKNSGARGLDVDSER